MTEEEYVKNLRFCTENDLICFEFHRRHPEGIKATAEQLEKERIKNKIKITIKHLNEESLCILLSNALELARSERLEKLL